MAPPNFLGLGLLVFALLVGSDAQQTFQFSSFSSIPQSLLDQLGSAQIESLKQQLNGGGGGGGGDGGDGGVPTYQVQSPQGGGGGSPAPSPQGGGGGQPQTLQFSSFSQIPQSVLDRLPSDKVDQLRKALQGNGNNNGGVQTYQIPGGSGQPGGQQPGQQQTLQFSSFSQIPQSVLDKLPQDQIDQIKKNLQGNGNNDGGVKTYQIGGDNGQPSGQPGQQQTFQFTSFSQIPQSLLDQLSSSQIENIKRELQPKPIKTQPRPQQRLPRGGQTLEFSKFSEIPQSLLDQFDSDQINQIRIALQQGGGTVELPSTATSYSYSLPGGNNKRVTNTLNTIFNYIAAGGYLTGIPPVDLILLRFYISMGPEQFCG